MHHALCVEQVLHPLLLRERHRKHEPIIRVTDLRAGRQALQLAVELDEHFIHVPDLAELRIGRDGAQLRRRGMRHKERREEPEPHWSTPASMTSKSRVTSAVFCSMAVAEQYFSWVSRTAFSTMLRFRPRPRTVQCMWILVKTLGSVLARSAVSFTSQPVTSWPLFLRITTTS